ncbi:MAG TPA: urate oxidase [Streptosporangiaceae bacterium]|jgi:urate oxidase|nr:urate oxidase [Streptosporangiaceae bacterium]
MGISLGPNQYGKAETRVVRIDRDGPEHQIHDLNVSTALRGDFAAAYLQGDQSLVLPTDTQKNTVYAYARERGVGQAEDFALGLARHFADDVEPVRAARVDVDEYGWERIAVGGEGNAHSFVRTGQEVRMATAIVEGTGAAQATWVLSGLRDLVVLKSTGSEFAGFLRDQYTTLAETHDRVLATSLTVRWRHVRPEADWAGSYASVRQIMLERFASLHSLALQQSLWEMGRAVLEAHEGIAEIRLSAPNKHHFVVDLSPFGLDNPGEVFHADDRPYGLIQCAVTRDDAPPAGASWEPPASFA